MKKKLAAGGLVLVVVAAGFLTYRLLHRPAAGNGALTLYGNVDIRSVDLGFRVGGRIAAVGVEEGDKIARGEVLARLDAAPYRDELDLAEARQAQAAAQLAKLEAGHRPQEIAQAAALVAQRNAALANLETDYRRKKNLLAMEAVSRQAYDDTTARLKEARAELTTAAEGLKLMREGFRVEDIAAARADLHAAAANVETAKTRLADTAIKAPAAGVILTRVSEPGAIVAAGQTVLTLSLENPVWVRAYVDEPQLGLLAPGMAARVVTDTAPGHPYRGHVGFISPEAEFTPKTVQTTELRTRLVYQIRIVVDDPDHGLRQGMPVTVHLLPAAAETSQ
jgi:HlyD family secretion protein